MIDFGNFYQIIAKNQLAPWLETLPAQLATWQKHNIDNRYNQWLNTIEHLPMLKPDYLDFLHSVTANNQIPLSDGEQKRIRHLLMNLSPWRKGPFSLYGINVDAEWRSDWKWQRLIPFITNLEGRTVLDVGCNSGYHLWRMIGAGAKLAVGLTLCHYFYVNLKRSGNYLVMINVLILFLSESKICRNWQHLIQFSQWGYYIIAVRHWITFIN